MKWQVAAPLAASAAFSSLFIARSSFTLDGRRSFSLFDDAMISMIYARNLAHGHGLLWNAGDEPVEGITNPLWTGVMALVHLGGLGDGQTSLAVMIIGASLIVVAALLARAIVQQLAPDARVAPILVLWLVVFYYPLVYWTLRGMEVGLVTVLLLAGILYCLRLSAHGEPRDAWRLAAVTAAGLWTRLDIAVFALVFGVFAALCVPGASRRRALAIFAGVVFAALAIQEAARVAYYHAWLPNTYFLKLVGFSIATRLSRGVTVLALGVTREFGVALAVAAVALAVPELRRRGGLLLLGVFAASIAYSTWVGGDVWEWMGFPNRYVTPGVVALLGLCSLGVERLLVLRRLRSWQAWWALSWVVGIVLAASARWLELPLWRVGIAAGDKLSVEIGAAPCLLLLGLLLAAVPVLDAALERLTPGRSLPFVGALCGAGLIVAQSLPGFSWWYAFGGAHVSDDGHAARFGHVLGSITDPEARVAGFLAGNPIYFANRKGVDLLGKNDDRIAALPPRPDVPFLPGHSKWDYQISVIQDRPDVVTELWYPTLEEVTMILDAGYVPVEPLDHETAKVFAQLRGRSWLLARGDSPHVRWDRVRRIAPQVAREWARKWLH